MEDALTISSPADGEDADLWTAERLNETVDAELPADMRARLVRISELIESVGLPNVKERTSATARWPLWEIRLK